MHPIQDRVASTTESELFGEAGSRSPAEREANQLERLSGPAGSPGVGRRRLRQALGEDAASAGGGVSEEPADVGFELDADAVPREIGEPAGIATMDPSRGLATLGATTCRSYRRGDDRDRVRA